MTDAHTRALLEAVLAGDVAADDEAVAALRRSDPEAARELDELLAIQLQLEVEAAAARASDADRDQVGAVLQRLARAGAPRADAPTERAHTHTAPPRTWPRVAALLLVGLTALWAAGLFDSDGPTRPEVLLGPGDSLTALSPVGAVDDYPRFACALPAGVLVGRAELLIWDDALGADAPPVLRLPLRDAAWEPDAAQRAQLPERLRWELSVHDAQDLWVGAASAQAWRRSR